MFSIFFFIHIHVLSLYKICAPKIIYSSASFFRSFPWVNGTNNFDAFTQFDLVFFSLKYLSYNTCYEQHRTWLECALCILHSTAYFEVISWLNIVHRIECKPNAWTLLALIECKLVEIELQNVQISISNLVYRTCLKKWLL